MELKPNLVDGVVILDLYDICTNNSTICRVCSEQAVGIHNWLVTTGIRYVAVDFQDEKDVCRSILIELLQLRKRLQIPFVFIGLMDKPKSILQSYAYTGYPFFSAPEEAAQHLKRLHPDLIETDLGRVEFDTVIPCSRTRNQRLPDDSGDGKDDDYDQQDNDDDNAEESMY